MAFREVERNEETTLVDGGRSQNAIVNESPRTLNFRQYITENLNSMTPLKIVSQPYNDDVLEWNSEIERYQLKLSYVKSLRDVMPYKNDRTTQQRIKQTSLRVYNYIFNHSNTANRAVVNFLLKRTENGRKFLKEVLTAQIEADMEYGYNDLMVRPVINAVSGQEGDRDNFRLNAISLECEEIINDSVGYFGFNICYLPVYPWSLFTMVRQYGE